MDMDEEQIRENIEKLRALLNTAADAIVTINMHGIITGVNPATTEMFGYTEDEMMGQNVGLLMPEPYRVEHDGYIQAYLKTGVPSIIGTRRELTAVRKDGSVFPIELSISEFHDGMGPMFTGIIHDISRRRELEHHLADARIEEQQRLARELHDGLGGQLTGIAMLTKALLNRLENEESPYASDVSDLARHIDDAHTQLRSISRGLLPVEMLPQGLARALEELAAITDKTDTLSCTFDSDGVQIYQPAAAMHLYRIAQEAVSNAIRHAEPTQITIHLDEDDDHAVMRISNNGSPFQHLADGGPGMGIRTMKHRADMIRGELRVIPTDTNGTTVICRVPNKRGEPCQTKP